MDDKTIIHTYLPEVTYQVAWSLDQYQVSHQAPCTLTVKSKETCPQR